MPDSIPVTDVTICNAALQLIGMPTVANLGIDDDSASTCNLQYPLLKRSLLSKYNWPWSVVQERLAIDATATPLTQYTNAFSLPSRRLYDDPLLVVLSTEENAPPFTDFEIQNEHLHTNQADIYIWYLSKDGEAEEKWPEYFVDLMIHALAARIAMPLTEDQNLVNLYTGLAWGTDLNVPGGMYAAARARSFADKPPVIFQSYDLILARLGGS